MQRPCVSVIVPIYNTAEYLPRCIESIQKQSYTDIEIILVDDGSKDSSVEVCHRYAKQDSRIKVIAQENKGNTAARKAGLSASTGEYIMFVDSDDWIGEELVSVLYSQMEKEQADMVISDVLQSFEDGRKLERRNQITPGTYYNPKEAVKKLFFCEEHKMHGILVFVYAKLYRRELICDVVWQIDDKIQYAEDVAIVWTCLMREIKVVFLNEMLYYYCTREEGLVQSQDELYLAKMNYFYLYMKHLFETEDDILKYQLDNYMVMSVKKAINWKLGLFQKNLLREKYFMDLSCFFDGMKKVVLYGAGVVGRDYHQSLQQSQNIQLCAWIDKNDEKCRAEGLNVQGIDILKRIEYDYILIAIKKETLFDEIRKELLIKGIAEDKIIWGKPCEFF